MKGVTKWNNRPRYMWVWYGEDDDFMANRVKEYVVFIHQDCTRLPVLTVDQKTGSINYYQHCAEIDEAEVDLAEEERFDKQLASDLAWAVETCKKDYARAELSLERVTRIIQRKYPTLEATMTDSGLIYIDTATPHDEYYSLEDIRERYKD